MKLEVTLELPDELRVLCLLIVEGAAVEGISETELVTVVMAVIGLITKLDVTVDDTEVIVVLVAILDVQDHRILCHATRGFLHCQERCAPLKCHATDSFTALLNDLGKAMFFMSPGKFCQILGPA